MSREIKFRCYIKKSNKMWDAESLRNMGGFALLSGHLSQDFLVLPYPQEDYVLMQYTGLKDKNGKEVFEGDVVEAMQEYELGEDKWYGVGKVEYYNASFIFRYEIDDSWALLTSFDEVKIIGNIYENPELLETK